MTPEEKMFEAVKKRNQDYFKKLPQDVNLDAQNEQGNTLLHLLAFTQFVPQGTANILKRHPDPFIENQAGMTPRMLAEWYGHTSQAAFLAAYEASYTERQRRFQVKCQADALANLAGVIKDFAQCPLYVSTYETNQIAERMRRGANGRAD